MGTHLSRHFAAARRARGLRPVDLARLCGYRNLAKGANRVVAFEERGVVHPELLAKLQRALEIDDRAVAELIARDQREYREAWERWAEQPAPMLVYRRRLPSFAAYWRVPEELTTEEEALAWARQQAREGWGPLLLLVNRREAISIDEQGNVLERLRRTPEDRLPYLQLGRHRFRFLLGGGEGSFELRSDDAPREPQP